MARAQPPAIGSRQTRAAAPPRTGASRAFIALLALLLLAGCGRSYERAAADRTAYAERAEGGIVIAVVDDPTLPGYLDGVRLALDEILAARGGLLGRDVSLRVLPGANAYRQVRPTVNRIAGDPRISAVLGHRDSMVAVPASVVYNAAQVLFMPPFATREQLTLHGFDFVLRMLPDNTAMAEQSASLARLFGYRRMAVLHARDDYARELAFLFEDAARGEGIDIVSRGSFFNDEQNYRGLLGELLGEDFDAIYLSAETDPGSRIIAQLRELGIEVPIIGSDRLNFGPLARRVGAVGERTMVPIVYDIDDRSPRNARFIAAFAQAYGAAPNQNAAQGYDSMGLLADIITRAGSTQPTVLATEAHYGPPWAGLTGIYAFDPDGNLYGKRYRFNVLRFGRWWAMPGVTLPYVMARFRALQRDQGMPPATADADTTQAAGAAATANAEPAQPEAAAVAAGATEPAAGAAEPAAGASEPSPASGPAPESLVITAASAPEPPDPFDLAALSERRLDRSRRNQIWLALAQEMLGFRRLGLVVPATESGRGAISLARGVGAVRDFETTACELPEAAAASAPPADPKAPAPAPASEPVAAPTAAQDDPRRTAMACWSRLAREADAVLIAPDLPLDPALVRRLNRILRDYRVPSFTLADDLDTDLGLTLALVASGIDLDNPAVALRFNGLLNGLRVGELNRTLVNLPTISADLQALQQLGMRPAPGELVLISSALESRPDAEAPSATTPQADEGPPSP